MTGLGTKHSLSHLSQIENAGQFALVASSGCIRMLNEETSELYENVPIGTKVIVL
jgi:lipoprotein-anchoring transpeptidase ErfK/SrfK